jgi:hypothetical protein
MVRKSDTAPSKNKEVQNFLKNKFGFNIPPITLNGCSTMATVTDLRDD